jgi:hypothetical protein
MQKLRMLGIIRKQTPSARGVIWEAGAEYQGFMIKMEEAYVAWQNQNREL